MGITVTIENGRPVGYLTSAEFAQKCGVVEATIRVWVKRKKLKTVLKIGSDLWISESEDYPMRRKRADNEKTDIDFECFYFVEDVAAILEVDRETIRRWIRSGKLRANSRSISGSLPNGTAPQRRCCSRAITDNCGKLRIK